MTPTPTTNALDIYAVDTFMTPAKENTIPRSAQPSCLPYRPVNNNKHEDMSMFTDMFTTRASPHLDFPVLGQEKIMIIARQDREPFQLKFRQQAYAPACDTWIPRCLSEILDDLVDETPQIDESPCSPAKKQRIGYEPVKPVKSAANMLHPRPHYSDTIHRTLAFDY